MKRLLCIVLVMAMVLLAGCDNSNKEGGIDKENAVAIESSDVLLNQIWDTFTEDEKFAAIGGDPENMVDGKAGLFNLEDAENMNAMLHIPVELVEDIEEAASLLHAMNANTFTGAAYHLKEGADAEQFVTELKDGILSTQWMCGFPEKLTIYKIGNYVVAAFGNGDIMDTFTGKLTEVFGDNAVVMAEENIA